MAKVEKMAGPGFPPFLPTVPRPAPVLLTPSPSFPAVAHCFSLKMHLFIHPLAQQIFIERFFYTENTAVGIGTRGSECGRWKSLLSGS